MKKENSLIYQLQNGERIICKDCGKGFYITNAKSVKSSKEFFCEKCNSVVRISPNITIN